MQKVKMQEIAAELGVTNKEVVDKAKELGLDVKVANSSVDESTAAVVAEYVMTGNMPESFKKSQSTKKESATKKIDSTNKEEKPPETVSEKQEEKEDTAKQDSVKTEIVKKTSVPNNAQKQEKKPAEEKKQEEKPKELLSNKRRAPRQGFRIVRKGSAKVEEPPASKKVKTSVQELLGDNLPDISGIDLQSPKKKKTKKIAAQGKSVEKLSIRKTFASVQVESNNEVVLVDLNEDEKLDEIKKEFEEKANVKRPNLFGGNKQTRRTGRRKSKSKYKRLRDAKPIGDAIVTEDMRVYEFAEKINKTISEIITVLFKMGMMVTKNDFLDRDLIELIAQELEVEVVIRDSEAKDLEYEDDLDLDTDSADAEGYVVRAPIVTIMGHVDHGKTSLLDKIRNTQVASGESGGITQGIGAYTTNVNGNEATFIDTPGHEAFSQMRANGASVTDIVIIVVAADDGVKPQTIEAISHAKKAEVPIIVAVNKMDKDGANPDLVKSQMAELEITPVDWGGDFEFINVSAMTGEGIDNLLETIAIQADIMELKANPDKKAKAVIIESSIKKGIGPVATIIVQNGTLKVGDAVAIDTTFGRIRTISNDVGDSVSQILPSQAGEISGLDETPIPGAILVSMSGEKEAKDIASKRKEYSRTKELSKSTKVSLEELSSLVADGKLKSLSVIIKTDTQGSLEAIKGSLVKLKNDEVKINIIHSGVGGITQSDLDLIKSVDNSAILGFNVRPTGSVNREAKVQNVEIKTYSIIYDLLDDIKSLLSGMMSPLVSEENTGQAEVKDTFVISKVGTIAGCVVSDGVVIKGGLARVIRDGVVVQDNSKISSLKRFKDDAKEVGKGYECGIMLDGFNDIRVGDFIETFKEVARKAEIVAS
jgi:translation initiation factor IF-2